MSSEKRSDCISAIIVLVIILGLSISNFTHRVTYTDVVIEKNEIVKDSSKKHMVEEHYIYTNKGVFEVYGNEPFIRELIDSASIDRITTVGFSIPVLHIYPRIIKVE